VVSIETICAQIPAFGEIYAALDRQYAKARRKLKFHTAIRRVLDLLATDLINDTGRRVAAAGVQTIDQVRRHPVRLAGFSETGTRWNRELKQFLATNLYEDPALVEEREHSCEALEELFHFYMSAPEALPPYHAMLARTEPRHRVVCDYIAGMTDRFLLRQHEDAFRSKMGLRAGSN
jgi:dGTPase